MKTKLVKESLDEPILFEPETTFWYKENGRWIKVELGEFQYYGGNAFSDQQIAKTAIVNGEEVKHLNLSRFEDAEISFENPSIPKPKVIKPKRLTTTQYERILQGAMEDYVDSTLDAEEMGEEFNAPTFDMAESMIEDSDIYDYLKKEYPEKNDDQLAMQLQWDLESYLK